MAKGNQLWLEETSLQKPQTDVIEGETVTQEQITTAKTDPAFQQGQVMDRKIEVRRIISFDSPGEKVVAIQEAPIHDVNTATQALTYGDRAGFPAQWVIEGLANQNHPIKVIGRFQAEELEQQIGSIVSLDSAKISQSEDVCWDDREEKGEIKGEWIIYRKTFQAGDNPDLSEIPNQVLVDQSQKSATLNDFQGEQIIIVRAQKQLPVEENLPAGRQEKIELPAPPVNTQPPVTPAPAPVTGGNPFFAIRPGDIKP